MSHARLRAEGPLQWPVPAPDHPGTERLYTDGRFATASGRAHFIAVEHDSPVEPPDGDFPLTLTTGRVRDHWHTLTRTGKSPALMGRTPEPLLEVNLHDARRAGISDGEGSASARSSRRAWAGRCPPPAAMPAARPRTTMSASSGSGSRD